MTARCKIGLRVSLFLSVMISGISAREQSAQVIPENDVLAISIEMHTNKIFVDKMPYAFITLKNTSDRRVIINLIRVHVEGKNGEPPTTIMQRQMTGMLRPGDMPLYCTRFINVEPNSTYVSKVQLANLYDLHEPGDYAVYAEFLDPSSHRWVRSKSTSFEMIDERRP